MDSTINLISKLKEGDFRTIAKCITLVENELDGARELLLQLQPSAACNVIGITGPPGAGKSTLVNALLKNLINQDLKIAVVSVDPSSPFNYGALLGDRIRMSDFYLHANVFIRSVASRGSLGGLATKIIEILDVLRSSTFDYILLETVGVGQSEVEIAGIADTTIVVMVPEAGDEVQTMKAGVMEIADIFVVNKGDREHADIFVKNLKSLAHSKASDWEAPVLKCVATQDIGIDKLAESIQSHHAFVQGHSEKRVSLLVEKAYQLIQQKRMKTIQKQDLEKAIKETLQGDAFNVYQFVELNY